MNEVIKVTSKGQITLPIEIRKAMGITQDSYLIVERVGKYMLMKKAEFRMKEIQEILLNDARKKKITRKELLKTLRRAQKRVWGD
jgi:AbrB family looped-hinge helix DNA binding protein